MSRSHSVRYLAGDRLGVKPEFLEELAGRAVRLYRPFQKNFGTKKRLLANPIEPLKGIQRRINETILREVPMPWHVQGAVASRSPFTNATDHVGQRCVVRIDIRNFFPEITNRQVYNVWVKRLGYSPRAGSLLTPLTTYRGSLPLGAPTSSSLANLVLLGADSEIWTLARSMNLTYTRFVDDLVFSGDDPRPLISSVVRFLHQAGFNISRKKLEIMGPSGLQAVTGFSVNGKSPSVPRFRRDMIRLAVWNLGRIDVTDPRYLKVRKSVEGRIRYLRATNPGSKIRLDKQLSRHL